MYDQIGKMFVQNYYLLFDNPTDRGNLVHLYNVSKNVNIFEKLKNE